MKKIIVMGWALLVCQMATGVGTPKLDLVSKEGEKIRLSRAAALKPGVSGLIATSLEADKDAPEVPLRSVSSAILNRFVPIWEFIDTRIGNGLFGELSAAEQKNLITAIQKKLGLIKRSEIGELINAANYLDSQPLLQALLWQYSGFLGLNKAGIMQRLASDNIPKGLRTDVARAYFLMHGEDMATEFAKMTIPVDVLAAYGYIP